MGCGCGQHCSNCNRTYTCSCTGTDPDPAVIKCDRGEPCDIALDAGCVFYTPAIPDLDLPANSSLGEILELIVNGDELYLLSFLNAVNNNVAAKALFCQIVNSC